MQHQRYSRVVQRDNAGGKGHFSGYIHRLHPFCGQAELFFQIERAFFGCQLYRLLNRRQLFKTRVAGGGFHHIDHILVYLLLLIFFGNRLDEILTAQDFIQTALAEQFIPAAGHACGYAADAYIVQIETEFVISHGTRGRRGC